MDTSELYLHSNLSLSYSMKTLENFQGQIKKQPLNTFQFSPFYFLKGQQYKEIIWPSFQTTPEFHKLGDRVITVNNFHSKISFGQLGTIVGIYKDQIEVLLDVI